MGQEQSKRWLRSRITNLEVELGRWKQDSFDWEGRARAYYRDTVKLKKAIVELEDRIRENRTS